ncbi:helix-turn-helix domain-containing protein [Nitrosomonas sp. Nm58]|uniref:helix-turn-helix domain-containing protein n=1 Tax=Nitrosomonas sp. Nm58 TaxID=200126 RepID=UPI000898C3A8|nr:helix-turn-helix transcriptional regulator [Nitrosomonas sp. Nm58]SDY39447.1 Helix-turn-helix domain-containing protein [Nitrosomonas sp. Nm58]
MNLHQLKQKALSNPAVKSEYDKLDAEFQLADALISMRNRAKLTQEEIAMRMGTQKSNVSRLERGNTNPSWNTIQNYAHACGFELELNVKEIR